MNEAQIKRELGAGAVFPVGEENPYGRFFDGKSYLKLLATRGVAVGNVTFAPGCRNHWHAHRGGGQILLCTGGRGYYQTWGAAARELRPGDVVEIGEEKHWHGAAPDSWFSHIAVEIPGGATEWLEPVSDAQYGAL